MSTHPSWTQKSPSNFITRAPKICGFGCSRTAGDRQLPAFLKNGRLKDELDRFAAADQIMILKKTKKSEKEVDIKPLIYNIKLEDDGIFMQVAQGSASNLKPDLVMDAFAKFAQVTLPEYVTYERLDMYCLEDDNLVSLDDIGGNIE